MRAKKFGLMGAGLICFLAFLPNTASARIYFRISFGSPVFHHYRGFYRGRYPHYVWHGDYYRWLDRDRYIWLDRHRYGAPYVFGRRHSYWRRPPYASGFSIWIGDCYPVVLDPPVIVTAPKVITKSQAVPKTQEYYCEKGYDENRAELFEKLRRKKSELLKTLKIGNKEKRIGAIRDLAGFSFDGNVRKALEDVLLSDPDPELRRQVAESLGKTANKNVVAALQKAKVEDSNRDVRQEAYKALIKIKGY